MSDRGRGNHLDRLEGGIADVLEQSLAGAEDRRNDVEVELVEDPGREVLLHGTGAACDLHILIAGCGSSLFQR
jgi:hypothetical protein